MHQKVNQIKRYYQNYSDTKILDLIKINLRYEISKYTVPINNRLTAALQRENVAPQRNIADVGPASTIARVSAHKTQLSSCEKIQETNSPKRIRCKFQISTLTLRFLTGQTLLHNFSRPNVPEH